MLSMCICAPLLRYTGHLIFINLLCLMSHHRVLPMLSNADANHGMWYVFRDGDAVIRAWGSSWTRLEQIYYDNVILKRYSNTRRRGHYSFSKNGHHYRINCRTGSVQRWQVECELWKDDQLVQVIKCKRRKLWNLRPTFAHLCVGLGTGLLGGLMNMPWWFGIVFIFASLTTTLLTTAKTGDIIFEHEQD